MHRALLLTALILAAGCTHLPWKPYRGWRSWKTSNITLHTDTISQHEPALEWLESVYGVYQGTFFRDYKVPPAEVLYLSSDITPPFIDNDGDRKFGMTIARWPWAEARGGKTLVIVGYSGWQWHYHHQLAHHFIEAAVPRAPLWFHEGLARFLTRVYAIPGHTGGVCFGGDQPVFTTRVTLPLKELLSVSYKDYNETKEPWVGPLSQSFIDYLMLGEGGQLRSRFGDLMRALAEGKKGEEALTHVYPELALDKMDANFRAHTQTLRPPGKACTLGFRVDAKGRSSTAPVRSPVSEDDVRALFESLAKLPDRNGYADFHPDGG